jgi:hypothetical protein
MFYPNVILVLSTALITTAGNYPEKEKRIVQYCKGINQIADYIANTNSLKVIHVDNTIDNHFIMHEKISSSLKNIKNIDRFYFNDNYYGKNNKGAGTISQWRAIKKYLQSYDYIIHYEPRMFFINYEFLDQFFEKNDNYFKDEYHWDKHRPLDLFRHYQVHTGLFSLQTKFLVKFIDSVDLEDMVKKRVCIESILYSFIKKNKINYCPMKKLGVSWDNGFINLEI